jgi:MoxR-like ATPase
MNDTPALDFDYDHLFDPKDRAATRSSIAARLRTSDEGPGDRRDGRAYVYTPGIRLAIDVALTTRRPLLIRGPSGYGKSSLARHVADVLGWRYYERVITSRTQAQDLLWEVDHVRRLRDAQSRTGTMAALSAYVRPGVLWWAFDHASALKQAEVYAATTADNTTTNPDPSEHVGTAADRSVVLLDEIDKADPDVPNNLLVPLGSLRFRADEAGISVGTTSARAPLVFITTNNERELPAAFLRRCVDLELEEPTQERLVSIGKLHFPKVDESFLQRVATFVLSAPRAGGTAAVPPSPAEYIDTVRAFTELEVEEGSKAWQDIVRITVSKFDRGSRPTR